jgi:hypothetical protein
MKIKINEYDFVFKVKRHKKTPILNALQTHWADKYLKPLLDKWEWEYINKYYLNKD